MKKLIKWVAEWKLIKTALRKLRGDGNENTRSNS
jgi:hypothetical protein